MDLRRISLTRLVSEEKCDRFLDAIIEYADKNNLGIGGGFRPFTEEELS